MLRQCAYQGWVSVEMGAVSDTDNLDQVQQAMAFVNRIYGDYHLPAVPCTQFYQLPEKIQVRVNFNNLVRRYLSHTTAPLKSMVYLFLNDLPPRN